MERAMAIWADLLVDGPEVINQSTGYWDNLIPELLHEVTVSEAHTRRWLWPHESRVLGIGFRGFESEHEPEIEEDQKCIYAGARCRNSGHRMIGRGMLIVGLTDELRRHASVTDCTPASHERLWP
jgi:hypothetical protein